MFDFPMMCETMARIIFQCSRFGDPLGRLANTDSWAGLREGEPFSKIHQCKAWAMVARLKEEYLDSNEGRDELYDEADQLEDRILNAHTNGELREVMKEMYEIVKQLNLRESPHISYRNTNDNVD